jgi:hypothetical protein
MMPALPCSSSPATLAFFIPILVESMPPGMWAAPYPTMNSEMRKL